MDQAKSSIQGYFQGWVNLPQPKKMKILSGIAFGCFSMFLLFVVIYGFGGTGKKSVTIPNIVVFMEAMPYNFQALRYLSKRRDVAVAMVVLTVNSWNTDVNEAYAHTAAFQKLLNNEGYADKVPIYYGNTVALIDINQGTQNPTYSKYISDSLRNKANDMFGAGDELDDVDVGETSMAFFEDPLKTYLQSNTARFLILGPCTDAAWFLQENEALHKKVSEINVAGGAFNSAGNMQYINASNTVAEVNFFMDPQAAQYIVGGSHGRDVTLFPLDATYTWNETSYKSLITDELSHGTSITSASVVAEGLDGYYTAVPAISKSVSASVVAASFTSDTYLQNGASVTIITVNVRYGGSMSVSGQSYHPPSDTPKVTVVLKVTETTFFDHLVRVSQLSY